MTQKIYPLRIYYHPTDGQPIADGKIDEYVSHVLELHHKNKDWHSKSEFISTSAVLSAFVAAVAQGRISHTEIVIINGAKPGDYEFGFDCYGQGRDWPHSIVGSKELSYARIILKHVREQKEKFPSSQAFTLWTK